MLRGLKVLLALCALWPALAWAPGPPVALLTINGALGPSIAYYVLRGIGQMRGRNAEWAERAVREAVSLSASDALKMKVIDLIAEDVPDLLRRLDGRKLKVSDAERVLKTADVVATAVEPDWRTRFLSVVTDPSIAYILILLGIYALVFEFS